MNTLYGVLDVPPNCDAPKIKDAFRKAVKLSHPDLNVDDPEAAARLRLIVRAKTILSDPELRAVYDRMLEFERQRLHSRSKLLTVRDAMHVVILAAVIAGTFTLFTYISQAPFGQVKVAKDAAHEPVDIADGRSPTANGASGGDKSEGTAVSAASAVAAPSSAVVDTAPVLSVSPIANVTQEAASDIQSPSPIDPSRLQASEVAESSMPVVTPTTSNAIGENAGPHPTFTATSTTKVIETVHSGGVTSSPPVKDARFYRERGLTAYRNGDVALAITDFNLAIRLDPSFKTARIDRGIAFYRLGEFKRAFADIAELRRIERSNRVTAPPLPKASPVADK